MSFLTQMVVGQYVPGSSSIHRLNPFLKVCIFLAFTCYLFLFTTAFDYLVFGGLVLTTFLLTRLPLSFLLGGLKPIAFLIFLTFLIHVFMSPSGTWADVNGVSLPVEGVRRGVFFCARLILLVAMTTVLTLTTSTVELTFAIETLTRPLSRVGFPSAEFAMMLTIALRFIPVLFQELDKIIKAQQARGVRFDAGPLKARVQSMLAVLIPLFVNTFQRAFDLAAAMEIRCYEAGRTRGRLRQYPLGIADGLAILSTLLVTAFLILYRP